MWVSYLKIALIGHTE